MFGEAEIVNSMYDLGTMYLWDHSGVVLCHFFMKIPKNINLRVLKQGEPNEMTSPL